MMIILNGIMLAFILISIYYTVKMFAGDYDNPIKNRVTWYWNIGLMFMFWSTVLLINLNMASESENTIITFLVIVFILAKIIEFASFYIRTGMLGGMWNLVEKEIGHKVPQDKRNWFINKYLTHAVAPVGIFAAAFFVSGYYVDFLPNIDKESIVFLRIMFVLELYVTGLWYYGYYNAKRVFST